MVVIGYIVAILFFLLLVVSHELGHFAAAKLFNVRVNEFSVGMGPLIYQKTKGETQYSLRAIPIGGFCKLEGEDGDSDDGRSFSKAAWWKQIIILAAGATVNIIIAFLILVLVSLYAGSLSTTLNVVTEDGPADLAGIKAGDKIVAIDDTRYDDWTDIVLAINDAKGQPVKIIVQRGSEEQSFTVTPVYNEELGRYICGFSCKVTHSLGSSIKTAGEICISYVEGFRDFLSRLFRGKAESDDVVGVVGIVSAVGQSAEYGIINVIVLMAVISLNLGVVNLLPFPALDGGRILATIIRVITGGRFTTEMESYLNAAGFAVLMGLMVFLIFKDTINLFK